MSIRKAFCLMAAAAALSTPALADNIVGNLEQSNWAQSIAQATLYGGWVGADLRGQSVAIGNNFSSYTEGNTLAGNMQLQMGDVGAQIDVGMTKGVGGNVDLEATAVCNSASIANAGGQLSGYSEQRCNTVDPYAVANVSLQMVLGDTKIDATSISNNLELSSEGGSIAFDARNQVNVANNVSLVNAQVGSTNGSFSVAAQSIGNNISVHQTRP